MSENKIDNFTFWCQKVLPLVYDDSLSYYEVLCKVAQKLNEVIDTTNTMVENLPSQILSTALELINNGTFESVIVNSLLKDSIFTYNNVADMIADTDKTNYRLVYCKGYYNPMDGGGCFFIKSTDNNDKPHITGNGINFYYVINKTISVKMFGAMGDHSTDVTSNFQSAIDTGWNVFVPMLFGEQYIIKNTLSVNTDRQIIFSDLPTHYFMDYRTNRQEFGDFGRGAIVCDFDNTTDPVFKCFGQFQTFAGIAMVRSTLRLVDPDATGNIGIQFIKNTANGTSISNVDGEVRNCLIRNFNRGIECYGRGCWVSDNYFIHNQIDFYVYFRTDNWWKEQQSSTSMLQTYPEFYGRGIRFTNNRVHTSLSWTVRVDSEAVEGVSDWNQNVLNGAIISDNQIDLGRGGFLFNAPLYGCIISNNAFFRLSSNGINLNNKTKDTIISNNTIRGLISTVRPSIDFVPNYGIYINGTLDGVNFTGNVFENIKYSCILANTRGAINNCVFSNNICDTYGRDTNTGADYNQAAIVIGRSTVSLCSFVGNTFKPANPIQYFGIRARDITDSVWYKNTVIGNCGDRATYNPYGVGRGSGSENEVQTY